METPVLWSIAVLDNTAVLPEAASHRFLFGSVTALSAWGVLGILAHNRNPVTGATSVTPATWVTLLRGAMAALLVGFILTDYPAGLLAWIPAVVFAVAGLLDAVDGWIARTTDTVSKAGERLDTEADGLLVLVGTLLVVADGLAPLWFLAVGAARYLFVAGCLFRESRGLSVGTDDARVLKLTTYVSTMCAIWVGLLPVTTATLTVPLLSVVGVAMLLNFCRSWLVVTGRL